MYSELFGECLWFPFLNSVWLLKALVHHAVELGLSVPDWTFFLMLNFTNSGLLLKGSRLKPFWFVLEFIQFLQVKFHNV